MSEPILSALKGLSGLGGLGGTEVKTNQKSSLSTQLSIALNNQIGAGSSAPASGSQSSGVNQSDESFPAPSPVFGSSPSSNPSADLNNLLTGGGGVSSITGNKGLIAAVVVGGAALALFLGLKGRK